MIRLLFKLPLKKDFTSVRTIFVDSVKVGSPFRNFVNVGIRFNLVPTLCKLGVIEVVSVVRITGRPTDSSLYRVAQVLL